MALAATQRRIDRLTAIIGSVLWDGACSPEQAQRLAGRSISSDLRKGGACCARPGARPDVKLSHLRERARTKTHSSPPRPVWHPRPQGGPTVTEYHVHRQEPPHVTYHDSDSVMRHPLAHFLVLFSFGRPSRDAVEAGRHDIW